MARRGYSTALSKPWERSPRGEAISWGQTRAAAADRRCSPRGPWMAETRTLFKRSVLRAAQPSRYRPRSRFRVRSRRSGPYRAPRRWPSYMTRRPQSMKPMWLRWLAVLSLSIALWGATRPHYGGNLRVEVRQPMETADPPQAGPGIADLSGAFAISRWEGGREAVYTANDSAPGGRPYLDGVEIRMGRSLRDQAIDLELGKADVVELGPEELRRGPSGRKIWTSSPVRLLALLFAPRVTDAKVREAIALSVDRAAIHNVLLQRQGEISAALLPQWISGHAFLFSTAADAAKARNATAAAAGASRPLVLSVDDTIWRPMAERIALNARDAGLTVTIAAGNANADMRLVEVRIRSAEPFRALSGVAAALGLAEPPRAGTPEDLLAAERALLEGFRVVPLFHLPDVYGVSPRLKGGPGITRLGEWRFEDLWLEGNRP
ncbi:MAG: hypothetical protein C5B51_16205 [Terriglobia bacterium]|nr:MAG: hypothetical protein C5B51_16205 [Terriglobia bacterium]